MDATFEIFDHTADAGIRIHAPTLPELLAPAAAGLYSVIGRFVTGDDTQSLTIDLADSDPPVLLHDFLSELLILFERGRRMAQSIDVSTFTDGRLTATVAAASVDFERSTFHREVKAITYHELDIRTIPGGYEAVVIVDI